MFFGMTNLPAMFQGMMNKILKDMINEEKVCHKLPNSPKSLFFFFSFSFN